MAYTSESSPAAWMAVGCMIVGFILCTGAFIYHNNVPLWIVGGVVGAVGLVLGRVYHVMRDPEELQAPGNEKLNP